MGVQLHLICGACVQRACRVLLPSFAGVQGLERSFDSILEGEGDCKEADLLCHRATQELG